MRRGLDDTSESRDKFYQIFDGAFERGVAAITVHGRTVEQKYVGASRWEFLREVKQHAGSRVVIGSGDLFTPQACIDMIEQTGVDGRRPPRRDRESVDLQPGPLWPPAIPCHSRRACSSRRGHRRALSAGRGVVWRGALWPADVQVRHQVLATAS